MKKLITFSFTCICLIMLSISNLNAQNLQFSILEDTIYQSKEIHLINHSTGFDSTDYFKWSFYPAVFWATSKPVSSEYITQTNENLSGFINNFVNDSLTIILQAFDSSGVAISQNPFSITIFIFNASLLIPWTIDSCHEAFDSCGNLVCNGDFSWITSPPISNGDVYLAQPWNSISSADLFSNTFLGPNYGLGVPFNLGGYQPDHTNLTGFGNYIGLVSFWTSSPTWKESITAELKNTLFKGQRYNCEMYINLANISGIATNAIHFVFTSNSLSSLTNATTSVVSPGNTNLLAFIGNNTISDTLNWTHLSGVYIPQTNGEKYITIGNFKPDSLILIDTIEPTAISAGGYMAYYFIDDISVTPLPPSLNLTDQYICNPGDTIVLYANAVGDSTLVWSTNSTADSIIVSPLVDTFYTVTATDFIGCHTITDTVWVRIAPSATKPNVWLNDAYGCNEADSVSMVVQGSGAVSYLWNTGDTTSYIIVPQNLNASYSVTVSGLYSPCTDTVLTAQVITNPGINAPIISGNLNTCDTILPFSINNFNPLYTYSWTIDHVVFNQITSNAFIIDGTQFPPILTGGDVWVVVFDTICGFSDSAKFSIIPCCIFPDVQIVLNHCDTLDLNHPMYNVSTDRIEFYNLRISLNDTLYIDANTIFNDCAIDMGPYATMILRNGDSLFFEATEIAPCDTIMWNSIVIPNATQYLYSNSCIISYGTEAFKIENGAASYFTNNTFENNHRSLVIKNYNPLIPSPLPINYTMPNAYNGVFYNNTINGTSNYLYFPLHYYKSYSGVDLQNVYGFKVGNAQNASLTNTFKNLEFGIRAYNSEFEVHNAGFDSINPSSAGAGIWAGGSFCHSGAMVGYNSVSGSVANPNPPSYVSVISPSVNATNNTVTHSSLGIYASFSRIDARNNDIHAIHNGIVAHEPRGNSQIKNNTIEVTHFIQTPLQTEYTGIGILANRVMEQISQMNISDNTINNPVKTGIWVENLNSTSWQVTNGLRTVVGNNKVIFTTGIYPANSWQHYGIRMNNCDRAIIGFNQIENQGVVSTYYWDKQRGISLSDCKDARVYSNYPIYNIGTGIRAVGNNINTQFYCNSITNSYNGFYFEHGAGIATYISDQGSTEWATDNVWNDGSQTNLRMGGKNNLDTTTLIPNIWYFRGNGGADPQIFNPQIPLNSAFATSLWGMPGNTSPSICPQPSPNPSDPTQSISYEELRDHYFGEIVRDEIEFEVLAEEFNYFNGEYFFEEMDEYSDWLSLGTWEDTIYQNFYNYLLNSNIGEFSQVIELMENGSIDEAINQNNGIIPGNTIEVNEQFVNEMYLSYYLNDTIPPSNELQTLENIALLTPWVGGEAVYTARILLGIDPDNHGIAYRLQRDSSINFEKNSFIIFPNPTKDYCDIKFVKNPSGNIAICITDLSGKQIMKVEKEASKVVRLNISQLKSGVYFVKITDKYGFNEINKIIIY